MRALAPKVRRVLITGSWTFFLSALLNFGSISALGPLSLFPSVLVLLLIVLIGVLFDLVGTAATAARADAFAAMASQRIAGSREALRIVHAADSVASFCNDVVGDICGTLSGAVVATIVFQIATGVSQVSHDVVSTVVLALTAAVTVSLKALGKGIAIHNYVGVLMVVGRLMYFVETTLGLSALARMFSTRKKAGRKGKSRNDRSLGRK
jgi:CBS domain containing-hemolysin-like protein